MALIICPECGSKVSDKANACIHCGYPIHKKSITDVLIKTYNEYTLKDCLREVERKIEEKKHKTPFPLFGYY